MKTQYAYDLPSRRVQKRVSTYDGDDWTLQHDLRFVCDDWNVAQVLSGADSNALIHKYTWGLDSSGLNGNTSRDRENIMHRLPTYVD